MTPRSRGSGEPTTIVADPCAHLMRSSPDLRAPRQRTRATNLADIAMGLRREEHDPGTRQVSLPTTEAAASILSS